MASISASSAGLRRGRLPCASPSARERFTWRAVPGADAYQFQLSTNEDFAAPAVDSVLSRTRLDVADLQDKSDYWWRVRALHGAASTVQGPWSEKRAFTTAGPVATESEVPARVRIGEGYPNPFGERVRLPYEVAQPARVRVEVYDALGRRVAVLVDGLQGPGRYEAVLAAEALPSGLYLCRVQVGEAVAVRRLVLARR